MFQLLLKPITFVKLNPLTIEQGIYDLLREIPLLYLRME